MMDRKLLEGLMQGVPGSNGFDNLYADFQKAITARNSNKFVVFCVSMCLVETFLSMAKESNPSSDQLKILCNLVRTTIDGYAPQKTNKNQNAVEAIQSVFKCSKIEAEDYLNSNVGSYISIGGDHKWMSGQVLSEILSNHK